MLKLILYFYIRWNITTFFLLFLYAKKMSIMSWKNTTGKETDKNNYRGRMHVAVVKSWLWHPQGCRFESWFHECVSNKSQFLSFIAAQVAFLVNLLRESEGCTRAKNIVHQESYCIIWSTTGSRYFLQTENPDRGRGSREIKKKLDVIFFYQSMWMVRYLTNKWSNISCQISQNISL